jgi:hypothetical protein
VSDVPNAIKSDVVSDDIYDDYPRSTAFQTSPLAEESGWSFLYRLAEINGYVGSGQVLEYYESLYRRPLPAFVPMFHWLCLAPRHIEPISTWLDGLPGITLLDDAGNATKRFCPDCIREGSPFIQSWSDELRVCWMHRKPLLDRCWDCKQPLSWITGRWDACQCRAPLLQPPRSVFRFGVDSYPTVEEWAIHEAFERRERDREHRRLTLEDALEKLKVPHPLDPEFDITKVLPGDWRYGWWKKGPPPENFQKPFKVVWEKQEGGGWWFRRIYE